MIIGEQEDLIKERTGLKKEAAVQTAEKRVSLEALLKTVDLYEDMALNNLRVYAYLRQLQKDFTLAVAKVIYKETIA